MHSPGKLAAVGLAAALALLSACAPSGQAQKHAAWEQFVVQTDEAHKSSAAQGQPPDLSVYPYPESLAGQYDSMYPWYRDHGEVRSTLSAQEAAEDAQALFQLLHDFYGGYGYFGGDAAFQPALEQALDTLPDGGNVSARNLQQSLEAALAPLILDGHFALNGRCLSASARQSMYYVPDLYLDQAQAETLDPAYVKPTIGPDGALCYCLAALSTRESELPRQLGEFSGLEWTLAEAAPDIGSTVYERREVDGLTVLVNQVLSDAGAQGQDWYARMDELNAFADSGESYQGLPVFVIDLRGNVGGQPAFARRWFQGYTGTAPSPCRSVLIRWAPENDFMKALGYPVPDGPGAPVLQPSQGAWVEQDSVIFCLTDSATTSAGEWFAADLHTMEHVIFVGSNTGGAALMANNQAYYLPNSGLPVRFGTSLALPSDGNPDDTGYLPDLWVDPAHALEAVARMCAYYDLG